MIGSSLQIAETIHSEVFGICSLPVAFLVDSTFSKKQKQKTKQTKTKNTNKQTRVWKVWNIYKTGI